MKRFHAFCVKYDITNPFPLSEQLLCSFAAFLADQSLAPQTGKSYLSALRNMQISLGTAGPQGSIILANAEEGASRDQPNSHAQRVPTPHSAPNHSPGDD